MSKLGFFGGCFNPPTIAHMKIVEEAIKEFELEKLIIIPMGDKYDKKDLISFEHRYQMLLKMFENNSKVKISNMQENQQKRSYAIDSFNFIDEEYRNQERFFIMGLDNYANIDKWRAANKLIKNHKFIVFKRNNINIQNDDENIHFLDIDLNISSTDVRNKIKKEESLENLLTKEIIEYIHENELYK